MFKGPNNELRIGDQRVGETGVCIIKVNFSIGRNSNQSVSQ